MKCQKCEKAATFHITDLTGDELLALHLCPDCARVYLQPEEETKAPTLTGVLEQQLKLEQTAEDLKELDSRQCPVCGLSFYEFRQEGRLGCPNDYAFFGDELEPLLVNVHGDNHHKGKQPLRGSTDTSDRTDIIRMRREMKEAIVREDYENASQLRDAIRKAEQEVVE
ncbi:MAG: UvrB/UvrC motif-containing protein [Planctomycetota bacterium]